LQKISNDKNRLLEELKSIGVDEYAYRLADKGICLNIKLSSLSCGQANIIKQEALSCGIDAAVSRGTVNCSVENTDVLILGNVASLKKLIDKLSVQPFGLENIANLIQEAVFSQKSEYLKLKNKCYDLNEPLIMGILNTTPDSFSDGGKYIDKISIQNRLEYFKNNDVDIVDIGGESSRPGAKSISVQEEINRIEFAVDLALSMKMIVSVDTYKPEVAEYVLEKGVHLINDITGLNNSDKIAKLCKKYEAGICLMHMKGTPDIMQNNPIYENIIDDIYGFLSGAVNKALDSGINLDSIIIDPGFGFGKTLEDNYYILNFLDEFKSLHCPLLAGVSRKSMIGKVTDEIPEDRVLSSKIVEMMSLLKGADIIRTHDVYEANIMKKIFNKYNSVVK
jgi:dihydropteroate synthase